MTAPWYVQITTVIFCFLLVYWVLKRYAYGPILSIIDERRDKIQADLKEAADLRDKVDQDQKDYEERLRNIQEEARQEMQKLINEGKGIADTIREKARQDASAILEKAEKNIQFEMEKARAVLKEEVVDMTIRATEQLIKERLDDSKHKELIGDFLSRIERN